MKTLRNTIIAVITAASLFSLSSCGDGLSLEPEVSYTYFLMVSVRNNDGEDLVSQFESERWKPHRDNSWWGGEINPDKYTLDILLSNPDPEYDNTIYNFRRPEMIEPAINRPYFRMEKYDSSYKCTSKFDGSDIEDGEGYYYLMSEFRTVDQEQQNYLTYKISAPALFGDDSLHEIVVYWSSDDIKVDEESGWTWAQYPICTKVEVDGETCVYKNKVIRTDSFREYYAPFIEITVHY